MVVFVQKIKYTYFTYSVIHVNKNYKTIGQINYIYEISEAKNRNV